jgi:peptidoglycan/xylan/chitin deacetylase (PgdA/CDA1 family)
MVSRQVSPRQALRAIRTALKYPAERRVRASKGATAAARSLYFGISRTPSTVTIEHCLDIEREFGVQSSYFFTVGPRHPDDCIYALDDPCRFQRGRRTVSAVIRSIANEGFDVGLHGSFLSATTEGLLFEEKAALERVLAHPVQTIRQHYLNFDPGITPRLQDAAELKADCSLGFNRNLGFRAGTSLPFRMFDFERERPFRILEVPLIIQEAALLRPDSLQLDVGLAKDVMRQLYAEIEEVGGLVTVLFHPHSLLDTRYRELYRFVIEHSLERKAWVTSLVALADWWHARESRLDLAPKEGHVPSC